MTSASLPELVTQSIDPSLLTASPWNVNIVSPQNEERIEHSLKTIGFFKPILARTMPDGSLEILAGEHRWRAAVRLKHETVPVINLGPLDDVKAKEISLIDNGRYGHDDAMRLAEILKEIGTEDAVALLPYSDAEFQALLTTEALDLDSLGLGSADDTGKSLAEMAASKAQTHQLMRFKVPMEDSGKIQRLVERTMKEQGFTKEDVMSNAGNALVHLLLKGS